MTISPNELRLGRLLMVAFILIFLHRVATTPLPARTSFLVLEISLILAFAALYSWFWLRVAGGPRADHALLAVASLTVVVAAYAALISPEIYLFYYPSMVAGSAFRWDRSAVAVAGVTTIALAEAIVLRAGLAVATDAAIVMLLLGASAIAVRRHVGTTKRLEMAREEIQRLAVRDERLRIARDIHDQLGQTLSLIVLKSELAALDAPAPARDRIEEAAQAGRHALGSLRRLVSTVRQPTLAEELDSAKSLLEASGIQCVIDNRVGAVSPPVETALAWAVREAATNVLRHSGCRRCRFTLDRHDSAVRLEVTDNGRGTAAFQPGSGLRGLEERARFLGGRLQAGRMAGGFRVRLEIPSG